MTALLDPVRVAAHVNKRDPKIDWYKIAYLALVSRMMDEMEEAEGFVKYQFSARGHELPQILLSQQLTYPFDAASVYYRSRPFALGSGLTPQEAFAAGMARAGGISDGRDVGVVFNLPRRSGATIVPMAGDVGSQYTPAVGWAQAIRYRVKQLGETELDGSIAVILGGDGSVAANGFWSALTMATTLKLPVLFVIEDNGYAISVKPHLQTPGSNIAENLASFKNLAIWDGDGCDPAEAARLVETAVSHVRSGSGPGLLRLTVPRLSGHTGIDNQAYKTDAERVAEKARDPIPALHNYLVPELMSEHEWAKLVDRAQTDVQQAKEAAMQQPEADVHRITDHVWHDPAHPAQVGGLAADGITLASGSDQPHPPNPTRINLIEAIRRTTERQSVSLP
ncbi:MAG: thiamine pyrophosphate-dependent dehydrogenase E1 component subunit alpha, partial [Anaerolineae bacterium]